MKNNIRLDDKVLKKIAEAGILATKKYRCVSGAVRQLARRSTNHARGKRSGKSGNRQAQIERRKFKLTQWNVNGWKGTADMLTDELIGQDVLMLSETWTNGEMKIEDYETVAADAVAFGGRGRASGGLLIAVK
jgi:hypothetical protein